MTEEKKTLITETVRPLVSEKRFRHILGVYAECEYYADAFGLAEPDRENLLVAALLHDIAKSVSMEEQLALCARYGIDAGGTTEATVHELGGAALARERLGSGIVNDTVFHAILCHTTGSPDMTAVDRLLFLADMTEPGRSYDFCRELREYLHTECERLYPLSKQDGESLQKEACRRAIDFTINYLSESGNAVDKRTLAAREALLAGY
ncbi:MAG: HD domain-containing protein [Ruminococcus sp.]|nr:HD domain-containing protein [Candidatus Apopatosoma intestinale]